ncbi:hypothetical protein D3C71_1459410 [compost metagenome]
MGCVWRSTALRREQCSDGGRGARVRKRNQRLSAGVRRPRHGHHASKLTMTELHEQRTHFVQKVPQMSSEDLLKNGLELEAERDVIAIPRRL